MTPQKRKGIGFNKQLQLPAHKNCLFLPSSGQNEVSENPDTATKQNSCFWLVALETQSDLLGRNQGMHLNTSSFLFRHQHSALLPRVQPQTSSRSRVNRNLSICSPSASSRPWLQSHTLCLTEQEGTERKIDVSPIPHLTSPRNLCLDYFPSTLLIFQRIPICFSFLSSANTTGSFSFAF